MIQKASHSEFREEFNIDEYKSHENVWGPSGSPVLVELGSLWVLGPSGSGFLVGLGS